MKLYKNKLENIDFLHGYCQYLAIKLAERYNYKIILWFDYDYDIEQNCLMHTFCVKKINNKYYYIDIRGVTHSIDDIIEDFDYLEEPIISPLDIKAAKSILISYNIDFNDITVNNLANKIITENKSKYIIKGE